jgi:hypothetical protein
MVSRSPFVRKGVLALFLAWAIVLPSCNGSDPAGAVGGVTVGVLLNKMVDQLQQAIDNARNAGLSIAIEAGREANIAIANAQNAYRDSLNLTIDKVDPKIKSTLDQLQSLINDITTNANLTLDDTTKRTQQIVNSLPFRPHEPQLTKILPSFIVPSRESYPALIHFQGNFEYAAREGFAPILKSGDKQYAVSQGSTQELAFIIPISDLFVLKPDTGSNKFDFTTAELIVPWETSSFLGLSNQRHENRYQIFIGALPPSPGKLVLVRTTRRSQIETKGFTSGGYHLASTREAGNDDHKNVPYAVSPENGWHVVRNTSKFNVASAQGDWGYSFGSDDGDKVVYYVTTIHHSFGSSGSVDFSISFTQMREIQIPEVTNEPIDLKWGDSKSLQFPEGTTWKLIFDAFDGSHAEFTGADSNNPFIKIRNQQGSWIISTADPKTLNWP